MGEVDVEWFGGICQGECKERSVRPSHFGHGIALLEGLCFGLRVRGAGTTCFECRRGFWNVGARIWWQGMCWRSKGRAKETWAQTLEVEIYGVLTAELVALEMEGCVARGVLEVVVLGDEFLLGHLGGSLVDV